MSAAALPVTPALALPRVTVNPWLVALAVVIPTFMEVLDTTIANVALRYIAGGLSAPVSQGEWVITSYLAANAIILPMSAWIGNRIGRRNYFLLSIAVFTLASFLCGIAPSLGALVAFRILQGFAGGGLQPVSQSILLDAFPPAKHGAAMTLFGMAALIAPVVGPTLGGYITDNYGWQWIFYLNIPVGIFALLLCRALVNDPPYLREQRAQARKQGGFDTLGLALLAVTMVAWEVLLSKGQEWDWLGDPFYRVQSLIVIFVGCAVALVIRELSIANPLIHFRNLLYRNFRSACLIIFCAFAVLYANTTSLPGLLQSLFGYDATTSGLVLSPAGLFAILALLTAGALMGRGVDARYFIGLGLLVVSAGNLWLSHLTLDISPWQVVWPRVVVIVGLSLIFAPLNVAAFQGIPIQMRGAAVGLLALLRNEGGSVGTSVARTVLERREQFHTLRLNESLDPLNPTITDALHQGQVFFQQNTADPVAAAQTSLQVLAGARDQQALSLAYFDIFWLSAILSAALVLLVFLMRPAIAEKGAHLAAD